MSAPTAYCAAEIFDGDGFHQHAALLVEEARVIGICPQSEVPSQFAVAQTMSGMIVPGFVDLQVNGGGGVLFNNDPTISGIQTICAAHARFGTTALMVTLITDTVDIRTKALAAGIAAQEAQVSGYLGLHLEGPHLSVARKGTHDPDLIRVLEVEDLKILTENAGRFGLALTTIAPESVSVDDIRALKDAGYCISLGHTDCTFETASAYFDAGATMATHLFNAMSQIANRKPGLAGAALANPNVYCGLIADGHHVHPTTMGLALRAKVRPGALFLVTDAMSCTGSNETEFTLNGRTIFRRDGKLTLADGTLAGADIDMLSSVRYVLDTLQVPRDEAFRMASLYPAKAIGVVQKGHLYTGADADFLMLNADLSLASTWISGNCIFNQQAEAE